MSLPLYRHLHLHNCPPQAHKCSCSVHRRGRLCRDYRHRRYSLGFPQYTPHRDNRCWMCRHSHRHRASSPVFERFPEHTQRSSYRISEARMDWLVLLKSQYNLRWFGIGLHRCSAIWCMIGSDVFIGYMLVMFRCIRFWASCCESIHYCLVELVD